ncbi:HU family DNA-binding protein [Streptomyces sp. DH37]|uniref:HU family DNA-binding protein n=1 Tax=Streptomyces sp. DH37 TaxID=3040122 RepID=UPI0024429A42|nr:HU family DNA-binding protein [Streptomyces sp. DH37]MDG9703757.1 HU family DNA-binding protein [Streptomyces sp. DH37]
MSTTTAAGSPKRPRRLGREDLAAAIAAELGVHPDDANRAVTALLNTIARALFRGDEVVVSNFGSFKRVRRARRTARNPQTDERVIVPAAWGVRFRATGTLAELVKTGRKHKTATITKRPKTPRATGS